MVQLGRVEQVRENYLASFIEERLECQEKLEAKMENYEINRQQQIAEVKERLQEHVSNACAHFIDGRCQVTVMLSVLLS